jgi:hypothetical protein
MDRVLMRVVAMLRDLIWNIVDRNDAVKERDEHEYQKSESEVVEEGVEVDVAGRE